MDREEQVNSRHWETSSFPSPCPFPPACLLSWLLPVNGKELEALGEIRGRFYSSHSPGNKASRLGSAPSSHLATANGDTGDSASKFPAEPGLGKGHAEHPKPDTQAAKPQQSCLVQPRVPAAVSEVTLGRLAITRPQNAHFL